MYFKNSWQSVKYLNFKIHNDVMYHCWRCMLAKYFLVASIGLCLPEAVSFYFFLSRAVLYKIVRPKKCEQL